MMKFLRRIYSTFSFKSLNAYPSPNLREKHISCKIVICWFKLKHRFWRHPAPSHPPDNMKTKLILPHLVLQPSSFPWLHAEEKIQHIPLFDCRKGFSTLPKAHVWGLCFAREQALPSFGILLFFPSATVCLFLQISGHSLRKTVCHCKLHLSWKESVSALSIWYGAFLMPYYSFLYVLKDFPSCGVNQSMEKIWIRNLIKNYYRGSFPRNSLPVTQWEGQPGSGNRWPKRKTCLFVSVIVLTYSGLKCHVLYPKNFLNQRTFRGPYGRHSLLFIPVYSANVERQTFFPLPLPTQVLL